MTFLDSEKRSSLRTDVVKESPISTAWKSPVSACACSASKSRPARSKSVRLVASVIHPAIATAPALPSGLCSLNCGPVQLLRTVSHPYEAGAVWWTMSAAAAP